MSSTIEVGNGYIAWAKDKAIRDKGASGGFVTALMAAGLEKGFLDNVLVVKKKGVYEGIPVMTNDVEEVLEAAGSLHSAPVNLAKRSSSIVSKLILIAVSPAPFSAFTCLARRLPLVVRQISASGCCSLMPWTRPTRSG